MQSVQITIDDLKAFKIDKLTPADIEHFSLKQLNEALRSLIRVSNPTSSFSDPSLMRMMIADSYNNQKNLSKKHQEETKCMNGDDDGDDGRDDRDRRKKDEHFHIDVGFTCIHCRKVILAKDFA